VGRRRRSRGNSRQWTHDWPAPAVRGIGRRVSTPRRRRGRIHPLRLRRALDANRAGQPVTAARRFERNRASCGPTGLFTEEYDIAQRQLQGNFPQAFVHALLLQTAAALADHP